MIYKAHMYNEASLDPERCTPKSDEKDMRSWLLTHLRQVDHDEDIASMARDQQDDDTMEEVKVGTCQPPSIELSPNGSGAQATILGTTTCRKEVGTTTTWMTHPPVITYIRFGTPDPPTIPIKARGGTEPDNHTNVEHQNRFAPLRHQGSESCDQASDRV